MKASEAMNNIHEIRIKIDKNGNRRATFYCKLAQRWLPIRIADADFLIATGKATFFNA